MMPSMGIGKLDSTREVRPPQHATVPPRRSAQVRLRPVVTSTASSMPNGPDSPERLADLLSQFLKRTGMDARIKQSAVLEQWPTLVGPEIAGATQALSITDDGTLFVAVRSHAWMSELTMMERELLASVNRITGDKPILKLRWTLMR